MANEPMGQRGQFTEGTSAGGGRAREAMSDTVTQLVEEARASAQTEMERYFKLSPGERSHLEKFGVLPDVPTLAGYIDALAASVAAAWEDAALSQREAEAWELHGQQETFAREKAELGVDGRGLAALQEFAVDVVLADDLDERAQIAALWGVVHRHTAIAKDALGLKAGRRDV